MRGGVFLVSLLSACGGPGERVVEVSPAASAATQVPSDPEGCSIPGIYDARRRVVVRAPLDGRVWLGEMEAGTPIDAGLTFARIIDERLQADATRERARVSVLKAEHAVAALSVEHARDELESVARVRGFVPEDQVRQSERKKSLVEAAHLRSARVLREGQAARSAAELRAKQGELSVPFAGTVLASFVADGEWVPAGTQLFVVVDDAPRVIRALIDAEAAHAIAVGDQVGVQLFAQGKAMGPEQRVPVLSLTDSVVEEHGLVELWLDGRDLEGARIGERVRISAPWHRASWCTGE